MESPLTPSVDGNQGSSLWPASSKCVVNGCWQLCNILVVIRLHLALVSVAQLLRFSTAHICIAEASRPSMASAQDHVLYTTWLRSRDCRRLILMRLRCTEVQ